MNRLIKFEFRNLFKQKSFLICLIISTALIIIGILASNFLNKMAAQTGETDILLGVNAFDSFMGYVAGGNLGLLLAITISIYFGAEASDGTIKNVIAKGYKRSDFFISKVICVVIMTLIFIITGLIFNYLMCMIIGIDLGTFDFISLGCVSLGVIAEAIMFSSLSFIIFKTGANIVANICIPMLLPLILTLLDVLLKLDVTISDFWIENTFKLFTNSSKIPFMLIISICYIVVFSILGITLTKRKEIK